MLTPLGCPRSQESQLLGVGTVTAYLPKPTMKLKIMQILKQFAITTSALAVLAVSASANPKHKNTERSDRAQTHYQAGLVDVSSNKAKWQTSLENEAKRQTSQENDSYQPPRSPQFDEYLH
jgi:hypothetical protein